MVVIASSKVAPDGESKTVETAKPHTEIHNDEHNPLTEFTNFDDKQYNDQPLLTPLDLSIVLALCLDVKNSNPNTVQR